MEVRLSVTNGKANVKQVILGPETIIGRSHECNLKIASSQVSRRHCRIVVGPADVRVSDLGSANGTFLNGRALPPDAEVIVAPGNALTIGPLRFVFQFQPPAAAKPVSAVPDSDTRDAIPNDILNRAAAPLGEEETVEASHRKSAAASPLGSAAVAPPESAAHDDTDFEEGVPDRTLAGLRPGPVVVSPPEGVADTVLDLDLEAEAKRKAAEAAAKATPEVPESKTESGTAVLPARPAAVEPPAVAIPDFKNLDDAEEAEAPSPSRGNKAREKKSWNLLDNVFGGGKKKKGRGAPRKADDADLDDDFPAADVDDLPLPEETLLAPPASSPTRPAPAEAEFDPADFLLALGDEEAAESLAPHTKPPAPGGKAPASKPPEKGVAPRLQPQEKATAKPPAAPQVKSGNAPVDIEDDGSSLQDFLKNL